MKEGRKRRNRKARQTELKPAKQTQTNRHTEPYEHKRTKIQTDRQAERRRKADTRAYEHTDSSYIGIANIHTQT